MKKTLFTLSFFLLTSLSYCQEKIVEKYIVQVTYTGGGTEKIEVKNERHLNVPEPIVKDGSLFYDEEFLLLDVKKIKILNTIYSKNVSTPKSKYAIRKVKYWSDKYHRYINLNIISDPEAEKVQSELNNKRSTIFDSETVIDNSKIKPEKPTNDKDTIVVSTEQIVSEIAENGNIRKIKNSTLRLEGNDIKFRSDEDLLQENFIKEDIEKGSEEYLQLSALSLKKGIYIIEKNLNKENQIVLVKIVLVKLDN
jgi:hypothetical protein